MRECELAEPALDHLLSVLASRSARRGVRPDEGFAIVVAWLWTTRPERAVSLALRWINGTRNDDHRLPGPPSVVDLVDDGLNGAVVPLLDPASTRQFIEAVHEALAAGPASSADDGAST